MAAHKDDLVAANEYLCLCDEKHEVVQQLMDATIGPTRRVAQRIWLDRATYQGPRKEVKSALAQGPTQEVSQKRKIKKPVARRHTDRQEGVPELSGGRARASNKGGVVKSVPSTVDGKQEEFE